MKKKNCAIFEIVCYVVAAVLAVVALYMLYANLAYISEYLTAYGMTFSDMKGDIIQTVLTTFTPYFTYAFVVFGIGRIYHAVAAPKCECVVEESAEVIETIEAEAIGVEEPVEEPVVELAEEVKED